LVAVVTQHHYGLDAIYGRLPDISEAGLSVALAANLEAYEAAKEGNAQAQSLAERLLTLLPVGSDQPSIVRIGAASYA